MNITHKELCDFYRAYLKGQIPPSRKECLATAELMKFFHPRTRKRIKTNIVDHISRCALCAKEFELILEIKRGSEYLNREIGSWLESKPALKQHRKSVMRNSFVLLPFWRYVFIFAGIIFLSTSLFMLLQNDLVLPSKTPSERENHLPGIHLIEPVRGNISKTHLVFKWSQNEIVDHYVLELYDEALMPVWKSPRLTVNRCSIPDDLAEKLRCPKTYLWMVTGYTKTGRAIESPLIGITLID
jgi:hypothetical protein